MCIVCGAGQKKTIKFPWYLEVWLLTSIHFWSSKDITFILCAVSSIMQRRPPESASLNWHTAVWWVSIMAYVRSKEFQRKDALNIFLTGKQVHIQTMTRIKASDKSNCTMNWKYLLETISPTFWHAPGPAQCVLIYCCLSFSAFSSRFSVWPGAGSCWAMFIAFIIHPFNYPGPI